MKTKNMVFLVLGIVLFLFFISNAMNSFAKYAKVVPGNQNGTYNLWSIKIDNTDINDFDYQKPDSINEENVMEKYFPTKDLVIFVDEEDDSNKFFSNDILAPGRFGYFDIELDYTDVTVPFAYTVSATNDSGNKNIIEYIKILDEDDNDDSVIKEYMAKNMNSKMPIDNPFNVNRIDPYDEDSEENVPRVVTIRVYVMWKEVSNANGSNYADNAISGGNKVNYRILFKFKQIPEKSDEEEEVPVEVNPLDINDRENIIDNDNDGKISFGDEINLKGEYFYVTEVDTDFNNVQMIAKYNLNVGKNTDSNTQEGIQSSVCIGKATDGSSRCTLAFYTSTPQILEEPEPSPDPVSPGEEENDEDEEEGEKETRGPSLAPSKPSMSLSYWAATTIYPSIIYNSDSDLYSHISYYQTFLVNLGYPSVRVGIMDFSEIACYCGYNEGDEINNVSYSCSEAPLWLTNTSFWSGSAASRNFVWRMSTDTNFYGVYYDFNPHSSNNTIYFYDTDNVGVRPFVSILASEI